MNATVAVISCVLLHFSVCASLALRSAGLVEGKSKDHIPPKWLIVSWGTLASLSTLALPYYFQQVDPLALCLVRVVSFFYACKLLDLAVRKSDQPPLLLDKPRSSQDAVERRLNTTNDYVTYIWRLMAEMRYGSFDIHVEQKGRPPLPEQDRNITLPLLVLPGLGFLIYLYPLAELKCVFLLVLLQCFFEILHTVVHPGCRWPLFCQPFAAKSVSTFWATHWHAGAAPWLYSLGYIPGRKLGGRWLGVLTTFALTGLWHGWASAALMDDWHHGVIVGCEVWGLFFMFGIMILLERLIWVDKQGGLAQQVLVWAVSISAAGQCFRMMEMHTSIPWLRRDS